jgi:hypothetical protein
VSRSRDAPMTAIARALKKRSRSVCMSLRARDHAGRRAEKPP